jgi:hypothetical protein
MLPDEKLFLKVLATLNEAQARWCVARETLARGIIELLAHRSDSGKFWRRALRSSLFGHQSRFVGPFVCVPVLGACFRLTGSAPEFRLPIFFPPDFHSEDRLVLFPFSARPDVPPRPHPRVFRLVWYERRVCIRFSARWHRPQRARFPANGGYHEDLNPCRSAAVAAVQDALRLAVRCRSHPEP